MEVKATGSAIRMMEMMDIWKTGKSSNCSRTVNPCIVDDILLAKVSQCRFQEFN